MTEQEFEKDIETYRQEQALFKHKLKNVLD